ncbi:MAG: DegV family protein [Oscillospiraceae bacterium]|nr:DegV family protein [Oscillospiraceae bacterium]
MDKIKVFCDSTADLSEELYKKYDIGIVPLHVTIGDNEYLDTVNINGAKLTELSEKLDVLPKTSAVSVQTYIDIFKPYIDDGYKVIHINISSKFSSCYQNCRLAAQELDGLYPVDSYNLSTGSGHLVIVAAEMIAEGKSAQEIVDCLEELKTRVDASFVINKLDNLRKGGRCSALAALGANLLNLKPCIDVKDGAMGVGKKFRGNLNKVIPQYVAARLEGKDNIQLNRIFVTHSPMDESLVELAVNEVKKYQPFSEILVTDAGATVCTHCGAGTLGILYIRK